MMFSVDDLTNKLSSLMKRSFNSKLSSAVEIYSFWLKKDFMRYKKLALRYSVVFGILAVSDYIIFIKCW
jgi:hypothetical protein